MLDSLSMYTQKWDLTVNTNKTMIVVIRNGGTLRDNEKRSYNGCQLDIVDECNYLGISYF